MRRILALGICGVIAVEVMAFAVPDRRWVPVFSGAVAMLTLLGLLRGLAQRPASPRTTTDAEDRTESLRRWVGRTETLINRAGATRREWDRHLRPMLARQFEMATGQRQHGDRAAFVATGTMLFGPELWAWVDPDNIARGDGAEPGPGRDVLDDILQRLQRL